jgi:molybdopterin-guanine dinucleotide biosynthesis protein A
VSAGLPGGGSNASTRADGDTDGTGGTDGLDGLDGLDAIVLAGGSSRRMGGIDKTALVVDGLPLLDRVLAALAEASAIVVVGPARPVRPVPGGSPVVWAREDPPGGGPVAALAVALPLVRAPFVALLAADLPFLTSAVVARLRAAAQAARTGDGTAADGALLVDPGGRDQLLAGVWRTSALRAAMPVEPGGVAVRAVLGRLRACRLLADARTCADCDTPADLTRLRASAHPARARRP